jgi:hypothetical protein
MKARGTLLTYGSNREMQGAFTEALDRGGIRRRRRNRMLKKVRKFLHHRVGARYTWPEAAGQRLLQGGGINDLKRCDYLTSACVWRAFESQ